MTDTLVVMTQHTVPPRHGLGPVVALPAARHDATHFEEFEDGECYPAELVETFVSEYTSPGDMVFDPFAGSGTTLVTAQRMERRALGWEIHPERVDWCAARLEDPSAIVHMDTTTITESSIPDIDLAMTSPPYMTLREHPENPLTGYQTLDGDYARYLGQLTEIFGVVARRLTDNGRLVINVANLCMEDHFTPLAWDLARSVSQVARFETELVINWDTPTDWRTNDYCLVFRRPQ